MTTALIAKTDFVISTQSNTEINKTIGTFLANFMSNETKKAYVSDWKEFFEFLEKSKIEVSGLNEIEERHLSMYRDFLREKFSATSINRKLSALSSLFSTLRNKQLVKSNPVS